MPYLGGSQTDAFGDGLNHVVNPGRSNLGSITLGDQASSADQGLEDTAERWNAASMSAATTPQGVLAAHAFDHAKTSATIRAALRPSN